MRQREPDVARTVVRLPDRRSVRGTPRVARRRRPGGGDPGRPAVPGVRAGCASTALWVGAHSTSDRAEPAKLMTPRQSVSRVGRRVPPGTSGLISRSAANGALDRQGLPARCGALAQHRPGATSGSREAARPPLRDRCLILRITCEFHGSSGHSSESVRRSSSGDLMCITYAGRESFGVCTWLPPPSPATMISKYT